MTLLTESRDTRMNNARIDLAQGFVVYSERHLGAFAQIGEKHVRLFDQAMKDFPAFFKLDIQPDASLVAVAKLEEESFSIHHGEADPAGLFPASHGISLRPLDLDHLGT